MIHKEVEIEQYMEWKKEKALEYETVKAELDKMQSEDKKAASGELNKEREKSEEVETREKSRKKKRENAASSDEGTESEDEEDKVGFTKKDIKRREQRNMEMEAKTRDWQIEARDIVVKYNENAKDKGGKEETVEKEAMRGAMQGNFLKRIADLEHRMSCNSQENKARDLESRASKIRIDKLENNMDSIKKRNWAEMIEKWQKTFLVIGFGSGWDNKMKREALETIVLQFFEEEETGPREVGYPNIRLATKEGTRMVEGLEQGGFKYPEIEWLHPEAGRKFGNWTAARFISGIYRNAVAEIEMEGLKASVLFDRAVVDQSPVKAGIAMLQAVKYILEEAGEISAYSETEQGKVWIDREYSAGLMKSDLRLHCSRSDEKGYRYTVARIVFNLELETDLPPRVIARIEDFTMEIIDKEYVRFLGKEGRTEEETSLKEWFQEITMKVSGKFRQLRSIADAGLKQWNIQIQPIGEEEKEYENSILNRVLGKGQGKRKKSRSAARESSSAGPQGTGGDGKGKGEEKGEEMEDVKMKEPGDGNIGKGDQGAEASARKGYGGSKGGKPQQEERGGKGKSEKGGKGKEENCGKGKEEMSGKGKEGKGGKAQDQRAAEAPPPLYQDPGSYQPRYHKGRPYKRTMCKYHQQGRCNLGENCTYAHSQSEIDARPARDDSSWY